MTVYLVISLLKIITVCKPFTNGSGQPYIFPAWLFQNHTNMCSQMLCVFCSAPQLCLTYATAMEKPRMSPL